MPKRNLIWIAVIVGAGVATVLLTRTRTQPDDPAVSRFGPAIRAHEVLRHSAYQGPSDAKMQQGAVRGMVETLDEYSTYVPPDRAKSFRARLEGSMVCTGIVLATGPETPAEVVGSLPGSPANKAGIGPGGHVLAVDGNDVRALPAGQVRGLLESPTQRTVAVTIADDAGHQHVYKLVRRAIEVESVVGLGRGADGRWEYSLDAARGLACIRVREFLPATPGQIQQALRELPGLAGLVLDLRDNPGGLIEAGYATANLFLREGPIFTQVDSTGRRCVHNASANGTWPEDVPVIVLINNQTASAAEIVSGSLQLHRRAVLIGTRTRGKGLVQSMIDLPDNMGLANVTTSEFFLGRNVPITRRPGDEIWGVQPDVVLGMSPEALRAWRRHGLVASVAPAGGPRTTETPSATTTAPAGIAEAALAVDPQLAEAVRLLESPERMRRILAGPAATQPATMKTAAPAQRNP